MKLVFTAREIGPLAQAHIDLANLAGDKEVAIGVALLARSQRARVSGVDLDDSPVSQSAAQHIRELGNQAQCLFNQALELGRPRIALGVAILAQSCNSPLSLPGWMAREIEERVQRSVQSADPRRRLLR